MSLDSLSNQIKAEAKAEAETIIKAAEKQAKGIRKEAEDERSRQHIVHLEQQRRQERELERHTRADGEKVSPRVGVRARHE